MFYGDSVHGQLDSRQDHHGGMAHWSKAVQFMMVRKAEEWNNTKEEVLRDEMKCQGHTSMTQLNTSRSVLDSFLEQLPNQAS